MTGVFLANVGIIQAFSFTDANNTLLFSMIFVGINILFRLFDTAYEYLNSQLPLASVLYFAVLIQHFLLEQVNAGDFYSEEGRRTGFPHNKKTGARVMRQPFLRTNGSPPVLFAFHKYRMSVYPETRFRTSDYLQSSENASATN